LFGFLPFSKMEEVRRVSAEIGDPMIYRQGKIGHLHGLIKNYSYLINFPTRYFSRILAARVIGRRQRNVMELEATLRDRGHHFFGTAVRSDDVAPEVELGEFKPQPILNYYLERAISMLGEKGIPVYFVSMPTTEATVRARPDLPDAFARYLDELAQRHPNFRRVGNALPSLSPEYFGDAEHLNKRGATYWSEHVAKLVGQLATEARLPALGARRQD
jgi:hypothetical protein